MTVVCSLARAGTGLFFSGGRVSALSDSRQVNVRPESSCGQTSGFSPACVQTQVSFQLVWSYERMPTAFMGTYKRFFFRVQTQV